MNLEFSVFKPRITKEYLFSRGVNQESIMQYYLGIEVNSKKLFTSKFRSDNHVTCSLYKSKSGILYCHDFATNEHINCFEVVMRLYNCNYYKALDIIATDFGLKEGTTPSNIITYVPEIKETTKSNIQVQIKKFTDKELEWWKSFGIDKKLLKKYHVYSIEHVFLNGELKFSSSINHPIYGYYFGKDKDGKEKWKIYFPSRDSFRFLNSLSKKTLQGYKQLPKEGDILIITKSMKDCLTFNKLNLPAVSPNSETLFISDKQLDEFKKRFKYIIVIYDQDRPGKYNMAKIRHDYPELHYFLIPKQYGCKDISDLVKKYGIEKVKELTNKYLNIFYESN